MATDESNISDPLQLLTIEVDTRCNLRCTNCFALAALPQLCAMERETAFAIAREGRLAGFRGLHLTGGEPMLWPHFFDLLEYADGLGYQALLFNTNASLLNQRACERLRAIDATKLRLTISLNGDRENHNATRGAGSYEPAVAGLRRALAHDLAVDIFTTVERRLLPGLAAFVVDLFREFPGVRRVVLIQNHRVTDDDYPEVFEQLLSPGEFLELVRIAAWLGRMGYPVEFLDHSLVNVVGALSPDAGLPPSPNALRFGHLCVLQNGSVTASHSNRVALTTYRPGALHELLKDPEYLARVAPDDAACAGCDFFSDCRRAGHIRPSPPDYFDRPASAAASAPYCRRVLEELTARDAALPA